MRDCTATVVELLAVAPAMYRLTLRVGQEFVAEALPGHFVMLKTGTGHEPLLRRPFSIHRCPDGESIEILFRRIGKGTDWLASLRRGAQVRTLGPLGKPFSLPADSDCHFCLAGGGVGLAPLPFLAEYFHGSGFRKGTVLMGFRSAADVILTDDFHRFGYRVLIATEDGSVGHQGMITSLLPEIEFSALYACGPMPMLKALALYCEERRLRMQASLETMMACGVAACLGCAVAREDGQGYWHVCQDGPVFEREKIAWHQI
ncbi:MAG: dihydroorotate dehydrogenase electron transfer subunit [Thermodesulfobacteriota bacterium]